MIASCRDLATYGDVGTKVLGKRGKLLVDIFLVRHTYPPCLATAPSANLRNTLIVVAHQVFTQTGFCIGYTIFIARNIDSFMPSEIQNLHLLSVPPSSFLFLFHFLCLFLLRSTSCALFAHSHRYRRE